MTGVAPAIAVRGLVKAYAGRPVVDRIDFDVATGSICALLGPNGAGKTTTVEIIEGYRRPDGGEVRVLGLDPMRDGRALRGRLGLMLQGGGIYPQARPLELIRLYARFYRHPLDPDRLLERVGLADVAGSRYKVLSGGQRQRLALALALVGRPELVVLDEPTAGMDPAAKASTRELIGSLRDDGVTVLLTTHELADVERLADRLAIIDAGRIVARGTLAELAGGAAARLRITLRMTLAEADRAELEMVLRGSVRGAGAGAVAGAAAGASAGSDVRLVDDGGGGRYRLDGLNPDPGVVAALAAWAAERSVLIGELRTGGATLEERYLELTGGPGDSGG